MFLLHSIFAKYNLTEDKGKFSPDVFSLFLKLFKVILSYIQRFEISTWNVLKILLYHSKIMSIVCGSNIPPS